MKIDLAVWTAVEGYDWQPGSVYSPRELAGFKDEIGPLLPASLPVGGLFLKDGKVVVYRVQVAEYMDSHGRGAIYCVIGTFPEEKAIEVDFAALFNSPELSVPQKPFPTSLKLPIKPCDGSIRLGRSAFADRRFTGIETFSELGGWCEEARGANLKVKIIGTIESPFFVVNYKPKPEPVAAPPKEHFEPAARELHHVEARPAPEAILHNNRAMRFEGLEQGLAQRSKEPVFDTGTFLMGFVFGLLLGMIFSIAIAWLVWPSKNDNASEQVIEMQVKQPSIEQSSYSQPKIPDWGQAQRQDSKRERGAVFSLREGVINLQQGQR